MSTVFAVGPDDVADAESRLDALKSRLPQFRDDRQGMEQLLSEISSEFHAVGVLTPRIHKLSGDILSAAIQLAADANFYAPGSQTAVHQTLFVELKRRNNVTPLDVDDLHRTLVADRLWKDAEELRRLFPEVELKPLPSAINDTGDSSRDAASYWRVSETGEGVVRQSLQWPQGPALLIISHPGCGFSRRMLEALERDDALKAALPEFRLFLSPTFGVFDFQGIHAWNNAHPTLPHVLVDRPHQWRAWVSSWETPQLIFLVDSAVQARVVGWPVEGKRSETMKAAMVLSAAVRRERLGEEASP